MQTAAMEFDVAATLTTFVTLLIAELGDKTQVATLALSTKNNFIHCFIGSMLGFMLANLLAIPAGILIYEYFQPRVAALLAGVIFLAAGVATLVKRGERWRGCSKGGFLSTFSTIFLLELGDKTNLATLAVATSTGALLEVVVGVVLAAVMLMGTATYLGTILKRSLPAYKIEGAAGVVFIALGLLSLFNAFL